MNVRMGGPEITLWTRQVWLQRAWAFVRLLRPLNVVMIGCGVVLGAVLAGGHVLVGGNVLTGEVGFDVWLLVCSAMLVGAGANAFNDVFDLAIDRHNRPDRPLPSGLVSVRTARYIGIACSVLGVVLGSMVSLVHLALALGVVGLLMIYNLSLKRIALVGNSIIALVLGMTLFYGGWGRGPLGPLLVGAVFAFLTTLAREIAKDVEDADGDGAAGARTLPILYGPAAALRVVLGVLFVILLLTPVPYFLFEFEGIYLLAILLADGLLLRACWLLAGGDAEHHVHRVSNVLKSAMAAGMLALALGAVVPLG